MSSRLQLMSMATTAKNSKIEALTKILRQERDSGFQDSTVMGGLDRFLQRWADDLKPYLSEFSSYSALTPSNRKDWANAFMSRLKQNGGLPSDPASGLQQRPASSPKPPAKTYRKPPAKSLGLDDDVIGLRAVNKQNVARFKRLGIEKIRDLVYLFPHRHNDFGNIRKVSQLIPGEEQTVIATVWEANETGQPRHKSTQAILGDETGNFRTIWFNQPYLARSLTPGSQLVISGRAEVFRGQIIFKSPEYEFLREQADLLHTGRLVPVYPSTDRLAQRTLRRVVKEALDVSLAKVGEFLPEELLNRIGLMGLQRAIAQMHYPDSAQELQPARRRLAFDELLLLQLAVLKRRQNWQDRGQGIRLSVDEELLNAFLNSLPYSLTNAQVRVLGEITKDLGEEKPMSRLIQGDVGSGKTVVATAALLTAVFNGYQGALMAPTEILAEQHFLTITKMLSVAEEAQDNPNLVSVEIEPFHKPISIGLLIGSMTKRVKDAMHQHIANGDVDILIGTQALIQDSVEMQNLAVVVVDEQHRFGVMQRASLREKGVQPHLLAMSATPIPRSLALTLYGDLDLSTIDELPPGRQQIRTRWIEPDRRDSAYGFVQRQVKEGRQAFIVCPLIEESEAIQARAATVEHERLSTTVFPDLKLGLLHGRMRISEKEEIMNLFKNGKLDILVSTSVIEVGIDIPNASVMLIDGADRFGLSQLHQFRGRVGRGEHQSYCLLLSDSPGMEARERLRIVERVHDGFQLAEEDLRIRGPGDYLGTRQSGLPDMRVASITDQDILALARREAIKLLEVDPDLTKAENSRLGERFREYGAGLASEIS